MNLDIDAVTLAVRGYRKGWHEINWGTPRLLVDPKFGKQALHSYQAIPGIGTMIQAQARWVLCLL